MIDHIVGKPSPSWKRAQVFLVLIFWVWRLVSGDPNGPRLLWIRRLNRRLARFTPWQVVVSTLTTVYIIRNLDKILGLGAPEPLAQLYSPSYYRATWIATGLDAGFATAINIRPKWLRDVCSMLFSVYYTIYANEADEKLRRFRAVPTVEMLRATWNKTSNPIIRFATRTEKVAIYRKILLPRPKNSPYTRPITLYLFFSPRDTTIDPTTALADQEDLILDFPGGGFVAMSPEHHEERLRRWAVKTGKAIASIDYGKAPEYPYPYAIEEMFDVYRTLVESKGQAIGMSGRSLNMVLTGDSAGATLVVSVIIKILEHTFLVQHPPSSYHPPSSWPPSPLPLPIAVVLSYAALDFNFTSWMTPENLRVLRIETEADEKRPLARTPSFTRRASSFFNSSDGEEDKNDSSWAGTLRGAKDHLSHVSPLSVVDERRKTSMHRRKSWRDSIRLKMTNSLDYSPMLPSTVPLRKAHKLQRARTGKDLNDEGAEADGEDGEMEAFQHLPDEEKPIKARVRWNYDGGYSPAMTPAHLSPVHSPVRRTFPLTRDPLGDHVQEKLLAEVTEANEEVAQQRTEQRAAAGDALIATRLTMTSRTGYFQDRIISPSMLRAMAILYIGPHRNPDFSSDYHISPILAPSQLLAQFPPLLMQCGEKDPLVDDTIIFAGRVREAKRNRREELQRVIFERRMGPAFRKGEDLQRLEDELDKLEAEDDEDWVQMQIFPDWSHGYLQMPMLMREASEVIDDLAKWIESAFQAEDSTPGNSTSDATSLATMDATPGRPSPRRSFFSSSWPWSSSKQPEVNEANGQLHVRIVIPESVPPTDTEYEGMNGAHNSMASETETDADDLITLVPKARRPSHGATSSISNDSVITRRAFQRRTSVPAKPTLSLPPGDAAAMADAAGSPRSKLAAPTPRKSARASSRRRDRSASRIRGGMRVETTLMEDADRQSRAQTRSPNLKSASEPPKPGTPTKAGVMGQTITEAELVRRRRLLDSHIFTSDTKDGS